MRTQGLLAGVVAAMFAGRVAQAAAPDLTLWHGLTGPDGQFLARMADAAGKDLGGTNVGVTVYHWDAFFDKWVAACAANAPPDVVILHTSEVAQFADLGVMQPLDPFVAPDAHLLKGIPEATLASCRRGGKLYAVPLDVHPLALYYHADLVRAAGLNPDKPPRTREAFLEWARKLTLRDKDGTVLRYGVSMPATNVMTFRYWYGLLYQHGGRFLSPDGTKCEAASAAGTEALQFCLDLVEKEKVSPRSQQDPDKDFVTKKVAMTFQGPWWITGFREDKLDFRTAPVPRIFEQDGVWASSHVLALPVRNDPARLKRAFALLAWYAGHSAAWAASGQIPASSAVRASAAFTTQPLFPFQRAFVAELPCVVYTPSHPRHNEIFSENVMTPVVLSMQAAMLGSKPIPEALADMVKGVDLILARK